MDGPQFLKYGGATSCVLVQAGETTIVLDAGSGFLTLGQTLKTEQRALHVLLSHVHTDHLLGLPMSALLYNRAMKFDIYGAPRAGLLMKEQLAVYMRPPIWPVTPDSFAAEVNYHTVTEDFSIGAVQVAHMEGAHPGGASVYRLSYAGKSIVYATDYELEEQAAKRLGDFARGCDLLICDGQYSPEERQHKRGFGHSDWQQVADLVNHYVVKRVAVFHHGCLRDDAQLTAAEQAFTAQVPSGFFAKKGERITL